MKIIQVEQYQCEICERKYDIKSLALKCESGGILDPDFWKPGLFFMGELKGKKDLFFINHFFCDHKQFVFE